jgi:hypothetical protein
MTIFGEIFKGGTEGVLKGAGSLAKDIRAAITGNDVLSAEQKAQIEMKLLAIEEATLEADKEIIKGQLEINKTEASSGSLFRGGWRPATGWICVSGLAYTFIMRPILPWLIGLFNVTVNEMPAIDMSQLMGLLVGLLGMGGYRTFEKIKGLK